MADQSRSYARFSPAQRLEHLTLLITFSALALTGLPQKYASHDWAKTMIEAMGGIESIRIVHRVMATWLLAEAIYHGGVLSHKIYVSGQRLTMIPGLRDIRDVWDFARHNLGLSRRHPRMPRYNFGEKAEYLAVVWGTLVMALTGFMMWNPIAITKVLPGAWIPAARAAHGAEAVLAVLSILLWHMYNVHIRHFNRAMFTGRLAREQMAEEHAEELDEIEQGREPFEIPAEIIARRRRVFWPYAIVMTIILVAGLIYFVSFEQSAITTVPRLSAAGDTAVNVNPDVGNAEQGAAQWVQVGCDQCHGAMAEGEVGLSSFPIAGTSLSFEAFVVSMRRGPADMPAYGPDQLDDQALADLWVWLTSLESSQ